MRFFRLSKKRRLRTNIKIGMGLWFTPLPKFREADAYQEKAKP